MCDLNSPSTNPRVIMCDLIDLNSPSTKGLAVGKLASPLIPVPEPHGPVTGKRDSLENNPFDMILRETVEYVQKKNDPFEVTLQRALGAKRRSMPAAISDNMARDIALKQEKHTKASKLNSTLNEVLMNENKEKKAEGVDSLASDESMRVNLNENSMIESPSIQNSPVPCIKVAPSADLSILDQSSLNDTLSDIVCDKLVREQFVLAEMNLKVPKHRRSHSQGETVPLRKLQHLNRASQSIMDSLRPTSLSSRSMLSNASSRPSDPLNEGFLKGASSESSVFSNLSHLSGASKPSSECKGRLSLAVANRTMSRSFLESYSSSEIVHSTKKEEKAEIIDETMYSISPISLRSVNSMGSATIQKGHVSFCDLVERLNRLKTNPLDYDASQTSSNGKGRPRSFCCDPKEFAAAAEKSADTDKKLVDVDVFTPEENCSMKHCRSSVSDTSSDSVFTESAGKGNRRILQEARAMATMFEEMARKSSTSSSIDDLMNSNPLWISELLPAFEEEDAVGNLIDFSTSPRNPDQDRGNRGEGGRSEETDGTRAETNWKELETELRLGSTPAERKVAAATLLSDLRTLFEAERNNEASSLIVNLEKALGIHRESNAALLASCLETANGLARSPEKSGESKDIVKDAEGTERSRGENIVEEAATAANGNLDTDSPKDCDTSRETYVKSVDSDPEEVREKETISTILREACVEKVNEVEKSSRSKDESDLGSLNRTVATEFLANLSRLLNGQIEEELTKNILRNLGTVLNIATSNYAESKTKTDTDHEIQRTPRGSRLRSEKRRTPALSSSARLSTDLNSKKKPASSRRRSSTSQSPPIKNAPTPLATKSKSVSRVLDAGRKRVFSDPGSLEPGRRITSVDSEPDIVPGSENGRQPKLPPVQKKEKRPQIADAVKNKLRKKPETEVVNKRGPMKALLPVGNMHKRESFGRRTAVGTVTPPKPQRVISSTPRTSTAPVASSTPDNGRSPRKIITQARSPRKRNSFCDMSPVAGTNGTVTSTTTIGDHQLKSSSKPSSGRKLTPKRRPPESSIPKPVSPFSTGKLNSSFSGKPCDHPADSPQRSRVSRSTPVTPSKTAANARNLEKLHQSPLRDSNKLTPIVKPFNLITKLRRHSGQAGGGLMEKENNYA